MLIGITGIIGAGKSIVTRYLGEILGAHILSADEICRQELQKGQAGYRKVLQVWGRTYLDDENEIDRPLLRERVFQDASVRLQLESILHPLVREQLLQAKAEAGRSSFVIAEVPLLFESGWHDDFDWIVYVHIKTEQAITRVALRDGSGEDEIQGIISAQMAAEQKKKRSSSVIDNSGDLRGTREQVASLAHALRDHFSIHSLKK